jgi:hypothetical protein
MEMYDLFIKTKGQQMIDQTPSRSYADYIVFIIKNALKDPNVDYEAILGHIDKISFDLDKDGSFNSYKKILRLCDKNGGQYEITVDKI